MESKYKVHCFYILLILLSIIIGLISVEWSAVPGLVEYITFALTLSSLILAGLAIVYSIYSNTSISGSLSEISTAAKEVSEASTSLKISNAELKGEVEKLPQRLDVVDEHLIDTKNIITGISEKQNVFSQASSNDTAQPIKTEINDKILAHFLDTTSIRGMEILLISTLSYETGTAFSINEFKKDNTEYEGEEDYLYGFFLAASSLGLIEYTVDAKRRYVISYIHKYLIERLKEKMKSRIIATAKTSVWESDADESVAIERWLKSYNLIGEYFNTVLP